MTKQFDPQASYDVEFQQMKVAELVKGVFYEIPPKFEEKNGRVIDGLYMIGDQVIGRIDGLAIIRADGSRFDLVPKA
ncbi:hypothetical protein [Pseudomonas panipatensis]|uniref:Uncharacterized protein n=1 Tax=Pseudomonas panipatensis TaxID=428992 RepID=A0A1G8CWG3_9PSED|nr:hypothetical protein [Pseudomonas panipatensis]SDH49887.1 hypothetical protein SAMN05216272_101809 [Pseudomonas panipatensis]SMP63260.1 hypothetical protein SAMN06295951_10633 [Pseudomonas panipatensis]